MSLPQAIQHEHAWSAWRWAEGRGFYFRRCQWIASIDFLTCFRIEECCACQLAQKLVPENGQPTLVVIAKEDLQ